MYSLKREYVSMKRIHFKNIFGKETITAKECPPEKSGGRSFFVSALLFYLMPFLSQNQEQHDGSGGTDHADPQYGRMHRIAGNGFFGSDRTAVIGLHMICNTLPVKSRCLLF